MESKGSASGNIYSMFTAFTSGKKLKIPFSHICVHFWHYLHIVISKMIQFIDRTLVPDFCVMLFLSGYESGTKWYDRNSSTYSNSQI